MNALRARGFMSVGWLLAALVVLLLGVSAFSGADDKDKDKDKKKNPPSSTPPQAKNTPPPPTTRPAASDRQSGGRDKSDQGSSSNPRPSSSDRDSNNNRSGRDKSDQGAPPSTLRPSSSDRDSNNNRSGRDKSDQGTPPSTLRPSSSDRDSNNNRSGRDKSDQGTPPSTLRPSSSDRDSNNNRSGRDKSDQGTPPSTLRPSNSDRDNSNNNRSGRDKSDQGTTPSTLRPSNSDRDNNNNNRSGRDKADANGRPNAPDNSHKPNATRPANQPTRKPGDVLRGANNTEAKVGADGRIAVVRSPGLTILHNSAGSRRVIVERPDKTVIVVRGTGRGYVQRPFTVRNQSFVQRTYYSDNKAYARYYKAYSYRGRFLNFYMPTRYYSPGFYGWAYSPWASPVSYRWGWASSPWYGYYGGYFSPYSSYAGPSYWLTDYLVSSTLEQAYREGQLAGDRRYDDERDDSSARMSPEVKRLIADEVQRQLDFERDQAAGNFADTSEGLPPALGDGAPHVFVVGRSIDVANLSSRRECLISEGDVLQSRGPISPREDGVEVVVLASKGRDCAVGSSVEVPLDELAEMQNQMRERLDQGLDTLRTRQGEDGLPQLSSSARGGPVPASYAASLPAADPNAAAEIEREAQSANRAERDVLGDSYGDDQNDGDDGRSPTTISAGQTLAQVTAILGPPTKVVDLGAKKIYIYPDMKITFISGVVRDVE